MREETLERLITFNRALKVNYASLKENVKRAKIEQEKKTQEFAKGKYHLGLKSDNRDQEDVGFRCFKDR